MFGYDDAVARQFPAIRAGLMHATGLANGPSSPALLAEYRAEQQATSARLAGAALADLPPIAAWRRVFTRFGAKPTQYRNAAEALLRRHTKHGDIPSLNTLADIGNLVSIRYAMPVAVVDRAGVAGSITVRFATGGERFDDLGSSGGVAPEPGEVIFTDERNAVAARRWCWRQSVQSATTAATTEALIIVEGPPRKCGPGRRGGDRRPALGLNQYAQAVFHIARQLGDSGQLSLAQNAVADIAGTVDVLLHEGVLAAGRRYPRVCWCPGPCSLWAVGLPRVSRLSVHVAAQGAGQAECQGQGDPQQGGGGDLGAVAGPLAV